MQKVTRRIKLNGHRITAHQGWKEIDGRKIYFRSDWEFQFAVYLQGLKAAGGIKDWEHEPKTFWFDAIKRGTRSYLPDFKVTNHDGSWHWVEVKGYMDAKSLTKIKRFRKYYPEEALYIIDQKWFQKKMD